MIQSVVLPRFDGSTGFALAKIFWAISSALAGSFMSCFSSPCVCSSCTTPLSSISMTSSG